MRRLAVLPGGVAGAANAATEFTTSCRVRIDASSEPGISGRTWYAPEAPRISTCLMESIPSSASISISRPSMSAGNRSSPTRSPAPHHWPICRARQRPEQRLEPEPAQWPEPVRP